MLHSSQLARVSGGIGPPSNPSAQRVSRMGNGDEGPFCGSGPLAPPDSAWVSSVVGFFDMAHGTPDCPGTQHQIQGHSQKDFLTGPPAPRAGRKEK